LGKPTLAAGLGEICQILPNGERGVCGTRNIPPLHARHTRARELPATLGAAAP